MTKQKRLLALVLALVLGAGLLSGCSGGDSSSSGSGDASSSSSGASSSSFGGSDAFEQVEPMDLTGVTDPYLATAGLAGDTVVGTVGGYEITAAELLYWLNSAIENYLTQFSAIGLTSIPWDTELDGATVEEIILQSALEASAFYRLLPELGAAEGLTLHQEDLDDMNSQLEGFDQEMGAEMTEHRLWYQMMTREQFVRLYESGLMFAQLQELYYGEGSEGYPTDAEVLAYAQDQMGVYRAKHILLLTKDMEQTVTNEDGTTGYAPLDDATVAEKKALAEELKAKLDAYTGDDLIGYFTELADEYSEDSGRAGNPEGYTFGSGQMVEEFESAAAALGEGEVSEIVESYYGYHIILRKPLDEAKAVDAVRETYFSGLLESRIEDAAVEMNPAVEALDLVDIYDAFSLLMDTDADSDTADDTATENGQEAAES